ncbi:hypothetical protein OBBRIDRAFT_805673 [Obba rivulosa]|uniref:Hydrophobin n=1 Tax=Obba rivulosa TaxID=1052685 RepID=A0A8E2ATC1_9APHY|nr:hypothetical protein OBBRIDRAFT_805673 [Obba rivulosa]
MYAFKAVITASLLAIPAFALPQGGNACSSGTVQCCNTVAEGSSAHMNEVGKALKLNVDPHTTYATGCSSGGSVSAGGGASCASTPVCCMNNTSGGSGGGLLGGLIGTVIGIDCGTIDVSQL